MKMHRIVPLLLVCLLAFSAVACGGSASAPGKLHNEALGISYDPPEGWSIGDMSGMKVKMATGPATDGFAPNINIVDEKHAGSLEEYAELTVKSMKMVFPKLEQVRREAFTTSSGLAGTKLVVNNEMLEKELRQTFYLFPGKDMVFVCTCTALRKGGDALDATFDASMKSFKVHD